MTKEDEAMPHYHTHKREEEFHNNSRGRFLFINDVLCKTDDNDGEFVPSAIFGLLADLPPKSPAVTLVDKEIRSKNFFEASERSAPSFTELTLNKKRIRYNNDGNNYDINNNKLANYDLDSSVFNVFGVLSCGVLLDNAAGQFVDAASDDPFKPFLPSPHAGHEISKSSVGNNNKRTTVNDTEIEEEEEEYVKQDSNYKEEEEVRNDVHQICEQNKRAYYDVLFCGIRAENALTYCTSMKSLTMEQGNNSVNSENIDTSKVDNVNNISVWQVDKANNMTQRSCKYKQHQRNRPHKRYGRSVVKHQLCEYMSFAKQNGKIKYNVTKRPQRSSPQSLLSRPSQPSHDESCMYYDNKTITEFYRRWRKSEKYRINCHRHHHNGNCNSRMPNVFLPSFIPYRFQHCGKVIAPSYSLPHALANNGNSINVTEGKRTNSLTKNVYDNIEFLKVAGSISLVKDCAGNERSAIMCNASFLNGRSLFARGMYSTPRNDVSLWRHGSYSPLYFWQSFKPYNANALIDYNRQSQDNNLHYEEVMREDSSKNAYDAPNNTTSIKTASQEVEKLYYSNRKYTQYSENDTSSNKLSVLPTQEQKKDISDVIEYMSNFAAPQSKSMYSKAWRFFTLYFHHLGIVTELTKINEKSSDHEVESKVVRYRYSLCPSKLYHVEKEVQEKFHRFVVNESNSNEESSNSVDVDDIFQLTRKITTQADKADAWDTLLQTSRAELLRRIACIEQYLKRKHL